MWRNVSRKAPGDNRNEPRTATEPTFCVFARNPLLQRPDVAVDGVKGELEAVRDAEFVEYVM